MGFNPPLVGRVAGRREGPLHKIPSPTPLHKGEGLNPARSHPMRSGGDIGEIKGRGIPT